MRKTINFLGGKNMKLRDFIKENDITILDVDCMENANYTEYLLKALNERKFSINNDGTGVMSSDLMIDDEDFSKSVAIITFYKITEVENIMRMLGIYFKDDSYRVYRDNDYNFILEIQNIDFKDKDKKYMELIDDLEYSALHKMATRIKTYFIKKGLYTNEVLNHPEAMNYPILSLALPKAEYFVDGTYTEKYHDLVRDITEMSQLKIAESHRKVSENKLILPFFYYIYDMDSSYFSDILYSELHILNILNKSLYEKIPPFKVSAGRTRSYRYFDTIDIPIRQEYLDYYDRNMSTLTINDAGGIFKIRTIKPDSLAYNYIEDIKSCVRKSSLMEMGTNYDLSNCELTDGVLYLQLRFRQPKENIFYRYFLNELNKMLGYELPKPEKGELTVL